MAGILTSHEQDLTLSAHIIWTLRSSDARGIPFSMRRETPASTRRDLLKWTVATAAATRAGSLADAAGPASAPEDSIASTLGDRLWIWTHAEGSYKLKYGLPRTSRMTPVEGAVYLGVPNLLFICQRRRLHAENQPI